MAENLYGNIAYQEIKMGILNEVYKPGDILNERRLADKFQISRTPIREALKLLEGEGWITIIPWKGAVVSEITLEKIEEIFQIRIIIEPAIIELLNNKIDYKKKLELDKLFERQRKSKTKKEFMQADRKFHMSLVKWTGNNQFYEMVKELNDKIYMVGHKAINNKESTRDTESLEEHRRIIEALKNNDILTAKNLMILHIVETRRNLIKNFL